MRDGTSPAREPPTSGARASACSPPTPPSAAANGASEHRSLEVCAHAAIAWAPARTPKRTEGLTGIGGRTPRAGG
eukprot:921284-Prymnesium_polylepis.1